MHNKMNSDFHIVYSNYKEGILSAEVWKLIDGDWGCRFYKENVWQSDEVYFGKSEAFAENAAENYVVGIKTIS